MSYPLALPSVLGTGRLGCQLHRLLDVHSLGRVELGLDL